MRTRSAVETKQLARCLGRRLGAGDVVTLRGELGSGKTTFAKGLARSLGVHSEREVSSPTFVVIHEYEGRLPVFHLDWYRLARVGGADRRLAEECLAADGVTLIEWPERGADLLPPDRIDVRLRHAGGSTRSIEIRARGRKYENLGLRHLR
jgi:tRNA threonylcarbamoyladenosine biosynthesis protein TsaE